MSLISYFYLSRCLLSSGYARIGKWFFKPLDSDKTMERYFTYFFSPFKKGIGPERISSIDLLI